MTAKTVGGGCLCGTVRFEIDLPTQACVHCHCSMCRRAHGAAFVTWVHVSRSGFRVVTGEDALVRYASSAHGSRSFCGSCGSTLLFESTRYDAALDVVLANLDTEIDREPQVHVFADARVDWVESADTLPRLGGASGMEPLPD